MHNLKVNIGRWPVQSPLVPNEEIIILGDGIERPALIKQVSYEQDGSLVLELETQGPIPQKESIRLLSKRIKIPCEVVG